MILENNKKNDQPTKEIYLAGGCFWGTEHYFKQIEGVIETEVGYANGIIENPTYEQVCTDKTHFAETVHIRYVPERVSLEFLLHMYFNSLSLWRNSLWRTFTPQKNTIKTILTRILMVTAIYHYLSLSLQRKQIQKINNHI